MKTLPVVLILILLSTGCANMNVNIMGIDPREMTTRNAGEMVLGAVASFGVHLGAHYAASKILDIEVEQQDLITEYIPNIDKYDDSDIRWFARAGFLAQTGVNTILTHWDLTEDSYFTKGYTGYTVLNIIEYPINHYNDNEGDFNMIDANGGNGDLEYLFFLGITTYNFHRLTFKEKQL